MYIDAVTGHSAPLSVSTDHDPVFRSHRWQAHLRVIEVKEIKTVPFAPQSHPFVERVIGTVRREFLDHTLFWNSIDLQRKLACFKEYYNSARVHAGLHGQTPVDVADRSRPDAAEFTNFRWTFHCAGLVGLPAAA